MTRLSLGSLEVACLSTANGNSFLLIPIPLSETEIKFFPPSSIIISICEALASIAFSTSSLRAEAGRSTTSPAAI